MSLKMRGLIVETVELITELEGARESSGSGSSRGGLRCC